MEKDTWEEILGGDKVLHPDIEKEIERIKTNRKINGEWYKKMFENYIEVEHNNRGWLYEIYDTWESEKHEFTDDETENERIAWLDFFRLEFQYLDNKGDSRSIEEDKRWEYLKRRRGGRQKITDEKESRHYKRIVIKMNEKEYNEFEKNFNNSGMRERKQFIMNCCNSMDDYKAWKQGKNDLLMELVKQNSNLSGMANNLNQIAHRINGAIGNGEIMEELNKLNEMQAEVLLSLKKTRKAMYSAIGK